MVTIDVSQELLDVLTNDWSEPVQLHTYWPDGEGVGTLVLTARTYKPITVTVNDPSPLIQPLLRRCPQCGYR